MEIILFVVSILALAGFLLSFFLFIQLRGLVKILLKTGELVDKHEKFILELIKNMKKR